MLVLDTDVLTIIQRAEGAECARLVARLAAHDAQSIAVTIVSFEEQTRGWLQYAAKAKTSEQRVKAYARLHALLDDYADRRVLDFDDLAEEVYQRLVKAKIRIPTMDLRIAAMVLANDATLLSRNLKDFAKVPSLRVEDWTKE